VLLGECFSSLALEQLFTRWSITSQNLCNEDFLLKPLEPSGRVSAGAGTDKCSRQGVLPLQPPRNAMANGNSAQLEAWLWNMALRWDVTMFFVCLQGSESVLQAAAVIASPTTTLVTHS